MPSCINPAPIVKVVLQMMATQEHGKKRAGIMVPIPQYPLYSATNAEYDAYQVLASSSVPSP